MAVTYEQLLDGAAKYVNTYMYSGMNDWQELLARMAIARLFANKDAVKTSLINNPIIKTFAVMDSEGNVDLEGLAADVKRVISEKGKIEVSIPVFGKWTFNPDDVDELLRMIVGQEVRHEGY